MPISTPRCPARCRSWSAWSASLVPALDHLRDELGVSVDEIALIDTFTTQPTTDDLVAIVERLTSGALPRGRTAVRRLADRPTWSPVSSPRGHPSSRSTWADRRRRVAAIAVGSFASYDFRYGPQRGFDPAKISGAVTPSTNDLDFYLTIPKVRDRAAGYPITVYGHGLTLNGTSAFAAAGELGPDGGMVIGISALEHGRRGNFLEFFNFIDGFATREHFRQTVADMLQLVRMIRSTSVPPFDQVDTSRIRYYGLSLGGIMGSIFMGHEPDVAVGMLSVPGGGLPAIIRSDLIGELLQPLLAQATGVPQDDPFYPGACCTTSSTSRSG